MKRPVLAWVSILVLTTLVASSSACQFLRLGGQKSSAPAASQGSLTSTWAMTRVSNEPPLPKEFPEFITDQIFPKSPVWKVTATGNQPGIIYDGKKIWFNSLGFNVTTNTPTVTISPDSKSGEISGGGHVGAPRLPGLFGFLGMAKGIGSVSLDYTDKVDIRLNSQDQLTATITYNASGSYGSTDGNQPLNYQGKLVYTGTRR
jgi:hypothetical protein